jgi:hypothetical protein
MKVSPETLDLTHLIHHVNRLIGVLEFLLLAPFFALNYAISLKNTFGFKVADHPFVEMIPPVNEGVRHRGVGFAMSTNKMLVSSVSERVETVRVASCLPPQVKAGILV